MPETLVISRHCPSPPMVRGSLGRIAGAGLDIYKEEPPERPGLVECRNALAPHIASSRETRLPDWRRGRWRVVLAGLEGRRPTHPVNPGVLDG